MTLDTRRGIELPNRTDGGVRRPAERCGRAVLLKALIVGADVAAVALSVVVATLVVGLRQGWTSAEMNRMVLAGVVTLPVWPVLFARQHMYAARFLTRFFDELGRVVRVVLQGVVAMVVVGWLIDAPLSRWWTLVFLVAALVLVGAERVAVRIWFRRRRVSGRSLRRVVVVGTNPEAADLAMALETPQVGYEVLGFVGVEPDAPDEIRGLPVRHGVAGTRRVAEELGAQGVIVATTGLDVGVSNGLLRDLLDAGLHVEMTSGLRDVTPERMTVRPLGRHPVVYLEPARRLGWHAAAKRTFDVAVASAGLLLLLPVLAVSALAVKLTSRGPVLFRQDRVGRDGRIFAVLKLRTMVVDAEARLAEVIDLNESDGPLFKLREDPRVTRVGRWLRRTSIDELPQLWNVVRGDMSLVGPRPALPREVADWGDELFDRLRVRPGITGMWQVSGRSDTSFSEYQRLDLFYVDNWSILIDLGVLARTVPTVLSGRGAS
ncbi:MAG: sugar transferase [Microthrixaceae bacterium]